jgi:hypothetical protein
LATTLVLAACNPLLTDPVSVGGELEQTTATYAGPDPVWVQVAVQGAPAHTVFALALVLNSDRTGPTARDCATNGGTAPCDVTLSDVRMPNQRVVPGDGSAAVRLMTLWSGERVQLVLVCVDPVTQELGCPVAIRTVIQTVDDAGAPVGDLSP